ncbi:MAG: ABC transporter ATP-binding protein [Candidatus Bathyarchaeia archaeon]
MVNALLNVVGLKKYFPITEGILKKKVGDVKAVDGIDFSIEKGTTFALVGESGSGKTTVGKTILRLYEPTEGKIIFDGRDITRLKGQELKPLRRKMQIVYQDPTSSLNPRKKIKDILDAPLAVHKIGNRSERLERTKEILDMVELPEEFMYRYPHHLSGGQKQRVGIARALILKPRFVVLDEPTSSLDVSVQAKIIELLKKLQKELNLTYLFITHDLVLVKNISDVIGVMYLGRLMEMGPTNTLFLNPIHPYTNALLSSIPLVEEDSNLPDKSKWRLSGEIPSSINVPKGCPIVSRCPVREDTCRLTRPDMVEFEKGHKVWCHRAS